MARLRDEKGRFVSSGGAGLFGVPELQKAIATKSAEYASAYERGLVKAGLALQRDSQQLVPVEFGVLKNSANTRKEGSGFKTEVFVTYGTNYAIYVHENLTAYHRPPTQAKFLEQPARENREKYADILRKEMKS